MRYQNQLVVLALLGGASHTGAMKLNSPWGYTDEPQYVYWNDEAPAGSSELSQMTNQVELGSMIHGDYDYEDTDFHGDLMQIQELGYPGVTFVGPKQASLNQKDQTATPG